MGARPLNPNLSPCPKPSPNPNPNPSLNPSPSPSPSPNQVGDRRGPAGGLARRPERPQPAAYLPLPAAAAVGGAAPVRRARALRAARAARRAGRRRGRGDAAGGLAKPTSTPKPNADPNADPNSRSNPSLNPRQAALSMVWVNHKALGCRYPEAVEQQVGRSVSKAWRYCDPSKCV